MLMLQTGMLGVFVSLDFFLFYIFWEVMLIPMYLLIGVWGGPRRIYAAVKFILYTVAGSLLMLVGILYLYYAHHLTTGAYTFDLLQLYDTPLAPAPQLWLFGAFALAFAIKVPMFPFHTWLPDAHVEAPTAGSVILAGVLLKMGVYGFLRFAIPLFPEASMTYTPWIVGLALVGIVYGALVAMVQRDVKKLVAYSSVSHLGFVMLGLFVWNTQGMAGGILPLSLIPHHSMSAAWASQMSAARRKMADRSVCGVAAQAGCAAAAICAARATSAGVAMPVRPISCPVAGSMTGASRPLPSSPPTQPPE